ncbi:MAG: hypothetical protein P8175_14535 [Deltaproteobacteria bacterium]|jgi:hypothetical protein
MPLPQEDLLPRPLNPLTLIGLLPMIPTMNRVNRVYLVRHGRVVGYENFPVYGHRDVELTVVGRLQGEYLPRWSDS